MTILACESSTLLGSVAVTEGGKLLSFEKSMRQGSHSDVLNIFIEKALSSAGKTLSEIDVFVTGIGPGSFTGIRISLNTVKTLAYCHEKPVIGISSLHTLAYQAFNSSKAQELKSLPIVSMINAYKNMLYVATYINQNNVLIEVKSPQVIRVQNLAEYLPEKCLVSGDGYSTYQKFFIPQILAQMIRLPDAADEPTAKDLAFLAAENPQFQINWNKLLPLYLRASEAEENLNGIRFQPLI